MPHSYHKHYHLAALASATFALGTATAWATDTSNIDNCGFSANVEFRESAPRDRFTIKNTSTSDWNLNSLVLNLSSSAGNLIFDVTAEGAGVEVFQPFRTEGSTASLLKKPLIKDGDQTIELLFSSFAQGTNYQFSIDVDDQLADSKLGQIRVAGSEIKGAELTLSVNTNTDTAFVITGVFDDSSRVSFSTAECS